MKKFSTLSESTEVTTNGISFSLGKRDTRLRSVNFCCRMLVYKLPRSLSSRTILTLINKGRRFFCFVSFCFLRCRGDHKEQNYLLRWRSIYRFSLWTLSLNWERLNEGYKEVNRQLIWNIVRELRKVKRDRSHGDGTRSVDSERGLDIDGELKDGGWNKRTLGPKCETRTTLKTQSLD